MGDPELKPSEPPPPSFHPTTDGAVVRFGRYELIGELASGGMGAVYLARTAAEAGFQRLFALKIMHEHLARDAGFIEMLLDEARLTSGIHHPNVVPIIDLGQQDGRYFLVMDYVEGCSLAQLCARHRKQRDPSKLVPLVIDALEGLHAAHTLADEDDKPLHLVHRDVSGQNIMVGVDGIARVVDFGIAKAEARISSTRPGTVKGKVALMSPEQLRGVEVDARSDVFTAGAVLWSLLTGLKLFNAGAPSATMMNILEMKVPPPSTVGLRPPACFDAICLRALQRDPAARYQTAAEMANELRRVALANGLMASRAEIAGWVKGSFPQEFAARREAMRKRTSEIFTISDVEELPLLPGAPVSGTVSSGSGASGVLGSSSSSGDYLHIEAQARANTATLQLPGMQPHGRSRVGRVVAAAAGLIVVLAVTVMMIARLRDVPKSSQALATVPTTTLPATTIEPAPPAPIAPVAATPATATATPAASVEKPADVVGFVKPRVAPTAPHVAVAPTTKVAPAPQVKGSSSWDLDSPLPPQ